MAGERSPSQTLPITIIGILFFIFGFVTWLNGTLIQFLKLACGLHSDAQALLVTFAFYMAYFFLALPSSLILGATGYKRGMALGLLVMAAGAVLFIPAAEARSFGLFLSGLFVQGMGLALLQTASNPYVSVLGPIESAARRISIMGICNKVAGALAPIALSAVVLSGAGKAEASIRAAADEQQRASLMLDLAHKVVMPYGLMALTLAILACMVLASPLPEIVEQGDVGPESAERPRGSIFAYPHLLLGVFAIFACVGAEVMAGDVIGPYGRSLGMSLDYTKTLTSWTLGCMVLGYVVGVVTIPRRVRQEDALRISAWIGIALTLLVFAAPGRMSVAFVALLGLANALMWPAIFPMAIDGLGRFTKVGSALLIMGISGGAVVPQVYARVARIVPPGAAFLLSVLPCYAFILFYAGKGHRAGRGA